MVNERVTSPKSACNCSNSTLTNTLDPLSSNAGVIAMAAGLSIIVPILCVLILQLKRAKEAERERIRAEARARDVERQTIRNDEQARENTPVEPIQDPPPLYEQVFGSNFNFPAGVQISISDSAILLAEGELGQPGNGNIDNESESGFTNVRRERTPPGFTSANDDDCVHECNPTYHHGTRSNPEQSTDSISTISGHNVDDIHTNSNIMYYQINELPHGSPNNSTATHSNEIPQLNNFTATNSSISECTAESSSSHTIPSSDESLTVLTNSSSALSPFTSHSDGSIPQSPFSTRNHQNVSNNRHCALGNSLPTEMVQPHPGMHISVLELFPSFRGIQDNNDDPPPPSYEEALKILESTSLAKDGENIIN